MICSKIANFNRTEAALHQNGVEFRQQFNGAIRTTVTAPYNDVQRRLRFVTYIHTYRHIP